MKQTLIQKTIIPRNWLFGRLAYINNNLFSILKSNNNNFNDEEKLLLSQAHECITKVIKNKLLNSQIIKNGLRADNINSSS